MTTADLDLRAGHRVLVLGDANSLLGAPGLDGIDVIVVPFDAPLGDLARHAPYDRVIVTEPTRAVAWAWVDCTRLGGLILCRLDPTGYAARAVVVEVGGASTSGRFPASSALHAPSLTELPAAPRRTDPLARRARTSLPLRPWELGVPWFLAAATMPDGLMLSRIADDAGQAVGIDLHTADGSWCQITRLDADHRLVVESGPADLFGHVAGIQRRWCDLGRPGWDRLILAVTPDEHVVRLDDGTAEWQFPE